MLNVTSLPVTLGSGMIYDLTSLGDGFLTWGAYSPSDGGAGSTLISTALGEGASGNKTIGWSFSSFTGGITFGYAADVDETGTCASGLAGALCRVNRDSIAPSGFIDRGAIDILVTVNFQNGYPGGTLSFLSVHGHAAAGILLGLGALRLRK